MAGGWLGTAGIDQSWALGSFDPQPVRIPVRDFIEKDNEGKSHWLTLEPGQFIQGPVAHAGEERRVYVVTVNPPPEHAHIRDRWPRIISGTE